MANCEVVSAQKPDALALMGGLACCTPKAKLVIVDEGQHLRAVAALKVDRLVVGAVDMYHLAWIQAHPNTRRCGHATVGIRFVVDHGVDGAITVGWLIERNDALVTERRS